MKRVALLALFVAITGLAFGQGTLNTDQVAGVKEMSIDVNGNVGPKGNGDYGTTIWDNIASGWSAWWSGVTDGYINLDWGGKANSLGLGDHVVNGFTLSYGTNNMDPAGETMAVYYFDACTGWGNLGLQEAGFLFSGLGNGYGSPTLPPGYGWIWTGTVDLEASGYEFLLGHQFGIGQARVTAPTMGSTGLALVNRGFNGTQNAFDIYYPNGVYNGSWWFGTSFWATWGHVLFGTEGQGNGTVYGVGSQGNESELYIATDFGANANVHFMGKTAGFTLQANLIASLTAMSTYYGGAIDATRLVGNFAPGFPQIMSPAPLGIEDFVVHDVLVPAPYAGLTAYFQMVLSDAPLTTPPLDASSGMRMN